MGLGGGGGEVGDCGYVFGGYGRVGLVVGVWSLVNNCLWEKRLVILDCRFDLIRKYGCRSADG